MEIEGGYSKSVEHESRSECAPAYAAGVDLLDSVAVTGIDGWQVLALQLARSCEGFHDWSLRNDVPASVMADCLGGDLAQEYLFKEVENGARVASKVLGAVSHLLKDDLDSVNLMCWHFLLALV
jgi:hypothetical protein